ncbi:hypothetical protein [Halovivax cerinus]|uniref:DUF1102 domain-containing protein n=1 Tax=Halovivax cerinus TaxID=1487865 RepID=A0ABD5NTP5_9EURY|nr:hypothetical protein [Halovivax cerinus]
MDRRTFVLSAGAVAAGGGLVLGTGAFDSVQAERDVTVAVADDPDGYLSIRPYNGPNGNYATLTDGELAIDLTDGNGNVAGEGINTNAITGIANLFTLENQGTQTVDLGVTPVAFLDVDFGGFPPAVLGVLLVPQLSWGDWQFDPVDQSITIPDIGPGDAVHFTLAAIAFPDGAIDDVEIDDELEITAEA